MLALAIGAVFALAALGPEGLPAADLCFFHRFTGLACPACGLTRAAAAAAQGDFAAALRFHPLSPLVAIEMALGFALAARRHATGRPLPRRFLAVGAIATGALFVAVWTARLITGSLPP